MPFWILLGAFMKWNCTSHGRRCCDSYYWQWSVWSNWGDFISFSTKMDQFVYQIFFVLRAWRIFFDFKNKSLEWIKMSMVFLKFLMYQIKLKWMFVLLSWLNFHQLSLQYRIFFVVHFELLNQLSFLGIFVAWRNILFLTSFKNVSTVQAFPGWNRSIIGLCGLNIMWTKWFVDSEWFLLVDIFCTVLLLVLLQSAIKSEINGRFSGLVWKQPSIIFRRPSVIKQPTSNWRYSPLLTFCRVS